MGGCLVGAAYPKAEQSAYLPQPFTDLGGPLPELFEDFGVRRRAHTTPPLKALHVASMPDHARSLGFIVTVERAPSSLGLGGTATAVVLTVTSSLCFARLCVCLAAGDQREADVVVVPHAGHQVGKGTRTPLGPLPVHRAALLADWWPGWFMCCRAWRLMNESMANADQGPITWDEYPTYTLADGEREAARLGQTSVQRSMGRPWKRWMRSKWKVPPVAAAGVEVSPSTPWCCGVWAVCML